MAKQLGKAFGGKWTYDGMGSWNCDDDQRRVSRCSAGVDEFDNPLGPPIYYLYSNGKPAKMLWFGQGKVTAWPALGAST